MTSPDVEIRCGFDDADRDPIAGLLWEAFEAKFGRLLRDRAAAIAVLGPGLGVGGVVTAYRGGDPVGVVLLKDRNGPVALTARVRDYVRVFGPISGLLRLSGFGLIDERPPPGTLVLDAIAVADGARGGGIGTQLLAAAESIGRERRAEAMVLDVIVGNERAIRLYERLGYRIASTKTAGRMVRRLLGVRAYHQMRKAL